MTGSMMERLEENKFLITQSPVLNLLHAHGDSPKELCSSRLVPFANRTRFTPSVRKFANHLITLKNVCLGFHPSNILTILTPLTFAPCNRAETLAMTAFSGGGAPNSKPSKAFRHINPKRIRFTKTKQCNGLSGFAYGCSEANPDSEQIEPTKPQGFQAKLCERGANPRRVSTSYRLNVFKSMSDLPIRQSHHKPKTCAKINSPIKTYLINRIYDKLVL